MKKWTDGWLGLDLNRQIFFGFLGFQEFIVMFMKPAKNVANLFHFEIGVSISI
jgi:hypothetical protein